MQNLQNELVELLKLEDNLVIDGHLNKNKIVELALKVEPQLITLLVKNETFKKHFFQEVENVLVFDKIKFQRFVNNKSFLPDSYTSFKNKIGLITNDDDSDNFISSSNDVVLAWPHKDCVLEGGQTKEDQKRNEIFWNETLAPDSVDRLLDVKTLTNFKKYDKDGESDVTEIKGDENLIIKGNNLLALASLLKTHRGKIKLIYIDPPYNTGNDGFNYNDNFNHSTWLTFMKNRLSLAHKLLSEDGSIYVSCDDGEEAYLKILLDEIFNRSNFINTITYERSGTAGIGQGGFFVDTSEFILVYAKNKSKIFFNDVLKSVPLDYEVMKRYNKVLVSQGSKEIINEFNSKSNNEPVKIFKHFDYEISSISLKNYEKRELEIKELFHSNFSNIFRTTNPQKENSFQQDLLSNMDSGLYTVEYIPSRGKYKGLNTVIYYFNNEIFAWLKDSAVIDGKSIVKQNKLSTVWSHSEIPKADLANEGGVELKRGKKPEQLIRRIIELSSNENDYVLDFHLGSGTTAAVSHKMNRKYIGLEQLDYGENDSVKRLINVINGDKSGISKAYNWLGGGSFIYTELMQYNQNYIDKIQIAENKEVLISLWNQMEETAFLSYQFDKKTFNERLDAFKTAPIEEMKQYLVEILDKNQLYVNFSEIDDETFDVSEQDKLLNKQFYSKK
ncbi:site-specific DNA-methyltransferase [Flavobacterium sp.]|uniref:site-specific DNA-methyltransferase n=1 Tax=Flavobacterium sp. TaxID=239 RepID=UPI003341A2FE